MHSQARGAAIDLRCAHFDAFAQAVLKAAFGDCRLDGGHNLDGFRRGFQRIEALREGIHCGIGWLDTHKTRRAEAFRETGAGGWGAFRGLVTRERKIQGFACGHVDLRRVGLGVEASARGIHRA